MSRLSRKREYDPTVERLLKETADEIGVLTSQMKEAYSIYMGLNLRKIRNYSPVLIENMGLFYLSPYKTWTRLWKMLKSFRKNQAGVIEDTITEEEFKKKFPKYWKIHEHARKHYARTGKKYRARKRREALHRASGDTEQLQHLHTGGETERPAGA